MEDLRNFAIAHGAEEAKDLNHWDINFWSERLRESKYDINEVGFSLFFVQSFRMISIFTLLAERGEIPGPIFKIGTKNMFRCISLVLF